MLQNGNFVENNARKKAIFTTFYQATLSSSSRIYNVYSLMNIVLPENLWHLQPCCRLQHTLHLNSLGNEQFELKANFAPSGCFVDAHIGWSSQSQSLIYGYKADLAFRPELPWPITVHWIFRENMVTISTNTEESGNLCSIFW